MMSMTLYHGSSSIIQKPVLGKGKVHNDYGLGFYCTEHIELAKEWACTEGMDGYANQYVLDMSGLNILNLSDDKYTILHWLALLVQNRRFQVGTPTMKRGMEWLKSNFLIDINAYDVIIGYRADDSYFAFARTFLNNEITLSQLSYAMHLGKLGEQVVLKSERAFQGIQFVSYSLADNMTYFRKRKARDDEAREAYRLELEKEDVRGLYIMDMIREEMTADEPRLR